MGEYKIFFKESVENDLRSIPKKDLKKILLRIETLAKDPGRRAMRNYPAKRNIVFAKALTGLYIQFMIKSLQYGW